MVGQRAAVLVRWGGFLMQEITIKLWRHTEEQDWSAEIHGILHEHISTKTVDELAEYVVVAAQQALLNPGADPGARMPRAVGQNPC